MFWLPVRLLVGLRWRLTLRALQSAPALGGLLLVLAVLAPGALAVARTYHAQFASLPTTAGQEAALRGLLAAVYALWLLVLPGGLAVGRAVDPAGLRVYPVRAFSVALGATLGALLDAPLLLALPALGMVFAFFGHGAAGIVFVGAALIVFLVQTAALGQILTQAIGLILRPQRVVPLLVLLVPLLGAACYAMSSSSSPKMPAAPLPFMSRRAVEAKATGAAPTVAEITPNTLARWTPPALAAGAIASAGDAHYASAGGFLAALVLVTLATLGAAARLMEAAAKRQDSGGAGRKTKRGTAAARGRPEAGAAWDTITAVAVQELRCFARDPFAFAALRQPASLLLLFAFAWIHPDLGPDAGRNVRDLMSLGALFYAALWQMQWLCDRLGGDGGPSALMLLRYPTPRPLLLAGKNMALGVLLLGLDATILTVLCAWAQAAPALLGAMLGWLVPTLIVATALGNLVSVWRPFPLDRRESVHGPEPDRSLAFVYIGIGLATAGLLVPVRWLLAWGAHVAGPGIGGLITAPLILVYLSGVYLLCLRVAARALARREMRILRYLERG